MVKTECAAGSGLQWHSGHRCLVQPDMGSQWRFLFWILLAIPQELMAFVRVRKAWPGGPFPSRVLHCLLLDTLGCCKESTASSEVAPPGQLHFCRRVCYQPTSSKQAHWAGSPHDFIPNAVLLLALIHGAWGFHRCHWLILKLGRAGEGL